MLRVYEEIGDSMIMLFHTGDPKTSFSAPERLAHLLEVLPGLKIIAAHMGGYQVWKRSLECLVGKDLYFDISSTIAHAGVEQVRNMVLQHGAEKILFASDYPAADHKRAVAEVESLGLPDDMLEMIFYRNAEKLLGVTL
jgi:predicted TIM-barrel fold metal-dependent hydrolase